MIFFCIQWPPFICLRDRALRFSFEKNFDLRRPTVMTFCWLQTEHFWSEENCKRRSICTYRELFILLVVIPRFTLDSVSNWAVLDQYLLVSDRFTMLHNQKTSPPVRIDRSFLNYNSGRLLNTNPGHVIVSIKYSSLFCSSKHRHITAYITTLTTTTISLSDAEMVRETSVCSSLRAWDEGHGVT